MKAYNILKQFKVEVLQTILAIIIVFMVKTISAGRFLSYAEYCTSDIALAVCSGYLGEFFGRWSEQWWDGVILSAIGLLFSAMLYGISTFFQNDVVVVFISVLLIYYAVSLLFKYFVLPWIKNKWDTRVKTDFEDYIGYKDRDI